LFVALGEKNIQVVSMRNKSNRLEELFVNLVGRENKAAAAAALVADVAP
jgi:ABC-2 type transport system ATP-binding protein